MTVFSIQKSSLENIDRPIDHLTAMTRVNLQFCHKKWTVVRNSGLATLVIAFDMALTEEEFGPKKIDRNDDLTALMIWPEGE